MKERGNSFPCPQCGGASAVKDSRPVDMGIRRRRHCGACGARWTTWEIGINARQFARHLYRLNAATRSAQSALAVVAEALSIMEKEQDD